MLVETLPLKLKTPPRWAQEVLRYPLDLLSDHAHLEKKAAANALSLLQRWPEPGGPPEAWIAGMTRIAKDEAQHLSIVTRLLERRGSVLKKGHRNPYAQSLRELVRNGQGNFEVIDRLLVSALIELRSCERFALLAAETDDAELRGLYQGLWRSEHGHYLEFLEIGERYFPHDGVTARWEEMLELEAGILVSQPFWPGMHSWWK